MDHLEPVVVDMDIEFPVVVDVDQFEPVVGGPGYRALIVGRPGFRALLRWSSFVPEVQLAVDPYARRSLCRSFAGTAASLRLLCWRNVGDVSGGDNPARSVRQFYESCAGGRRHGRRRNDRDRGG